MLGSILHIVGKLGKKKALVVKRSPEENAMLAERGSYAGPMKRKDPNAKRNNKAGPKKD